MPDKCMHTRTRMQTWTRMHMHKHIAHIRADAHTYTHHIHK